jgi:hypothetical protein
MYSVVHSRYVNSTCLLIHEHRYSRLFRPRERSQSNSSRSLQDAFEGEPGILAAHLRDRHLVLGGFSPQSSRRMVRQ